MINRSKIWKLSLIALAVMLTVSCTKIDYVGKSYAPTATVDVYFSLEDIKGNYEVMGHLTATAGEFTSSEKMQEKIIEKAREKGADAVVILGLDHYIKDGGTSWSETTETEHTDDGKKTTTTGSQSSNTEEMKEISARFIKYKEHGE
jgi:hypothetical protein